MKGSIEKKKAFVKTFQDPLSELGFFVKNHIFYKCSKANRYMLFVEMELMGAGTLNRIDIGFGSNYAPIKLGRKTIYGTGRLDVLRYLERSNATIREESGQFAGRNDVIGFINHVEYIMPHVMDFIAPLISRVTSFTDYLAVEEALKEKEYEDFKMVAGGATETTLLGYLSLGDIENVRRIADKLITFHKNRIARYAWQAENDPLYVRTNERIEEELKFVAQHMGFKSIAAVEEYRNMILSSLASRQQSLIENTQRATKDMEHAIALRERIDNGSVDDLMEVIAIRDAQSIETCTRFFGERRYSAS